MHAGVYAITNRFDGKCYIGSSVNIDARFKQHQALLRKGTHHSAKLQRAWDKHGADAFEFAPLLYCAPEKQPRLCYEQRAIDVLKPLYNICPLARSRQGSVATEETKLKISASLIGNKRCLGFSHTAETKAKASATRMGRKQSPEWNANISKGRMGISYGPHSPEHTAKIVKSLLGNTRSAGNKQSAETIAKRVAKLKGGTFKHPFKGKKKRPEVVARMRAAQQLRRAAERAQRK